VSSGATASPPTASRPVYRHRDGRFTAGKDAEIAKNIPLGRAALHRKWRRHRVSRVGRGGYMTGAVIDVNGGIFMA